jgi:hypothetical protein
MTNANGSQVFCDADQLVVRYDFTWQSQPPAAGIRTTSEPVFLNVYGAQELIPRNEFRQPV